MQFFLLFLLLTRHSRGLLIQKLPPIQWLSLCADGPCWEWSCSLEHRTPWCGSITWDLCCFGQLPAIPSSPLGHWHISSPWAAFLVGDSMQGPFKFLWISKEEQPHIHGNNSQVSHPPSAPWLRNTLSTTGLKTQSDKGAEHGKYEESSLVAHLNPAQLPSAIT